MDRISTLSCSVQLVVRESTLSQRKSERARSTGACTALVHVHSLGLLVLVLVVLLKRVLKFGRLVLQLLQVLLLLVVLRIDVSGGGWQLIKGEESV